MALIKGVRKKAREMSIPYQCFILTASSSKYNPWHNGEWQCSNIIWLKTSDSEMIWQLAFCMAQLN